MRTIKNAVAKANAVRETGNINPYYDITRSNAREIRGAYGGNYESIMQAFQFGYMQGMKAAKAEMKKGGAVNG